MGMVMASVCGSLPRRFCNCGGDERSKTIATATIKVYDEELKVTVSIGVSSFPDNAGHIQDLIEMADQALYLAKESGKNKVCFCPA